MLPARPGNFWRQDWFGLTIYGYAMTETEVMAQEMALGASEDEATQTAHLLSQRYARDRILWGRAASVACPEGEYGSTLASNTIAITQEEYEAAEQREWKD